MNFLFYKKNMAAVNYSSRLPTILFFSTIIFYVCFQLITQNRWMLGGEMLAEMATNYFRNANSPSYYDRFFAVDFGYIPLPQRSISLVANLINIPTYLIPYFYTWVGTICSALIFGTFCLARFRIVIESDILRFLAAISILVMSPFEVKLYINFTYFCAFFIAIITTLNISDNKKETPWWSWFMPLFILSKPMILCTLPAMIIAAINSKNRFRFITLVSVILGVIQILQLIQHQEINVYSGKNEIGIFVKIGTAILYFLFFLGKYFLGQALSLNLGLSIVLGLIILCYILFPLSKKRAESNPLILVGLLLLFFNSFLGSFILNDYSNLANSTSNHVMRRHTFVGFIGFILIFLGLCKNAPKKFQKESATILFTIWLIFSGWIAYGITITKDPTSTEAEISQWQKMSEKIDSKPDILCVPINPIGWMYSRNCNFIGHLSFWNHPTFLLKNSLSFSIKTPPELSEKILSAAGILLKPISGKETFIEVAMAIRMKNGEVKNYAGSSKIIESGGMILLNGEDENIAFKDISLVTLTFNQPVEIATNGESMGVMWMGR